MSKAILEFDLKDPEDKKDFQIVTAAHDMADALFHIKFNLKKRVHNDFHEGYGYYHSPSSILDSIFEDIDSHIPNSVIDVLDGL